MPAAPPLHRRLCLLAVVCVTLAPWAGDAEACREQMREQQTGASHAMGGALKGLRLVTKAKARRGYTPNVSANCRSQQATASVRDPAGRMQLDTHVQQSGVGMTRLRNGAAFTVIDGKYVRLRLEGEHAMAHSSDQQAALRLRPTWRVGGVKVDSMLEQNWRQHGEPSSRAQVAVGERVQFRAGATHDSAGYWREVGASARTARPAGPFEALSASGKWELDRHRYAMGLGANIGKSTAVRLRHSGSVNRAERASFGVGVGAQPVRGLRLDADTSFGRTRKFEVRARYRF